MLKLALLANGALLVIAALVSFLAAGGFAFLYWGNLTTAASILGIALLVVSLPVFALAFRPRRTLIVVLAALNGIGALIAFGVALFAGLEPAGNVWFVALTGVALLALAGLEWAGLRRA